MHPQASMLASMHAYIPEALALFRRMVVKPDAARRKLIHDTIRALKLSGDWAANDVIYFQAAHTEQAARLNWKGDAAFDLTTTGTIAFTADRGFTGANNISNYLSTHFTPSTQAVALTLNSARVSAWNRVGGSTTGQIVGSTDGALFLMPRRDTDSSLYVGLNAASAASIVFQATTPTGLVSGIRSNGGNVEAYVGGALLSSGGSASSALSAIATLILYDADYQVAFTSIGAGRTAGQEDTFHDIIAAYMAAVGA